MVGRIVIMLAKIDPTILPACFRCQSSLRIGAAHLAVFNPRVFLSAGTKAVAFCRVAKQIVNCPKLVIETQASRSVQSPKKGMWVATLVKIQMVVVSDIAANLGGVGGIRLAFASPRLKRYAHRINGKIPLSLDFLRKRVIGLAYGWIS